MERLKAYHWPGNIRELENIIERAVILCDGDLLDCQHVQVKSGDTPSTDGEIRPLQEVERDHISAALRATRGKVSGRNGAAELLGLKPSTLESRMNNLDIRREGRVEAAALHDRDP